MEKKYKNFKDFYPYYISEHSHKTTKLLHFIGTTFSLSFEIKFIFFSLISGYGFAWVAHFFVEKNKPATFTYPLYSFVADHLMYIEILRGKHRIL
jgi:hypothetical protein